jgi:hypothetical protein
LIVKDSGKSLNYFLIRKLSPINSRLPAALNETGRFSISIKVLEPYLSRAGKIDQVMGYSLHILWQKTL